MIRNQCVNDGTLLSGQETRNSDTLRSYFEGSGLDLEVYEPAHAPGRASLVARIEGSDPKAPTLCLMGHTDVVPVNPKTWTRDPFGGELVNGEVWGRGAVDMLNLTASQAVALKTLAGRGWRPRGTLVYLACADEEAGGTLGAGHVVERHWDALRADYCLTENGGTVSRGNEGRRAERHRARGREGRGLAPPARQGHARPRLDALRREQRPGQGRAGGEPPGRLPALARTSTSCGAPSWTRSTSIPR